MQIARGSLSPKLEYQYWFNMCKKKAMSVTKFLIFFWKSRNDIGCPDLIRVWVLATPLSDLSHIIGRTAALCHSLSLQMDIQCLSCLAPRFLGGSNVIMYSVHHNVLYKCRLLLFQKKLCHLWIINYY